MVWPFSSSSADSNAQTQQPPSIAQSQQPPSTAPQPPQTLSHTDQTSQPSSSHTPTAAHHDADFYAAHPHLAPASFSPTSNPPTTTDISTFPDDAFDPMLPRRMSCRAAFDSAFYCSSLGGHFNDIYRYGQLRSCSEHWNDFWFCMRTKNSYNEREFKERLVQDRYREKEEKIRSGPNSEDVWVRRKPGEEVRGAFAVVDDADGS